MIELSTLIEILIGVFVIGGGVVGFFTMQKGQNMKIAQLEEKVKELQRKQSLSTGNQIQTEKEIIAINGKLDHILVVLEELKAKDNNHG